MAIIKLFDVNSGLRGWVLQRVTALFLAIYSLPLLVFWYLYPQYTGSMSWFDLVLRVEMRVLGYLAMLALMVHATIGIWVVATDYIHYHRVRSVLLAMMYLITMISSLAMMWLLAV